MSKNSNIDEIVVNGNTLNEPLEICTAFNEYFCNVGIDLAKNSTNSANNFKSYLKSPVSNSFYCSDVTLEELRSIITNLKPSKSSVGDSVSSYLLQNVLNLFLILFRTM